MKDKEAQDALKRVIGIIEAENVPEDLRSTAFQHVWGAVTDDTGTVTGTADRGGAPAGDGTANGAGGFASKLQVNTDEIETVYEEQGDGSFSAEIPTDSLDTKNRPAMVQLALLVCASRQFGGEDRTPADAIRQVCERYSKLDPGNFAKALLKKNKFWSVEGDKAKTYKLRKPGWEAAGELVRTLAAK